MAIVIFSEIVQMKFELEIFSSFRWIIYIVLGAVIPTAFAVPGIWYAYNPDLYSCWVKMPGSKIVCNPRFQATYTEHCDRDATDYVTVFLIYTWLVIGANIVLYSMVIFFSRKEEVRKSVLSQNIRKQSSAHLIIFPIA